MVLFFFERDGITENASPLYFIRVNNNVFSDNNKNRRKRHVRQNKRNYVKVTGIVLWKLDIPQNIDA